VKNADVIFVLENGTMIESGTHRELLSHGKLYAQLYEAQFQDEKATSLLLNRTREEWGKTQEGDIKGRKIRDFLNKIKLRLIKS